MKARLPDAEGVVERDGVELPWQRTGDGPTTVALVPTWSLLPSDVWKLQVPTLARRHTVVTYHPRGNPRAGCPRGAEHYTVTALAADLTAVLDATGTGAAVLVALSCGTPPAVQFAADHPERALGLIAIGPAVPLADQHPARVRHGFDDPVGEIGPEIEGWARYTRTSWARDWRGFLEFFAAEMFSEAHSTKPRQDVVEWGLEADPAVIADVDAGMDACARRSFGDVCAAVRCPVLVIHGDHDGVQPHARGAALAAVTDGELVTIVGGGHGPHARDPVAVNHLVDEFVERQAPAPARERRWVRAASRPKRALYVSSPIGLGHALRDVAIAQELRTHHPDLQIDWLAQHPVTRVLADRGEHVHPASVWLANESAHVEAEADEHDLHAFQAIRQMDEILVNNFMVFDELVSDEHYDLVIGDEAWDIDYFLHENPERKRFSFAWMTDFVGWLPMPDGGDHEAALTADYNAEMIEQRARFKRIRDRSIFVGGPEDVVPDTFGPGLPTIRSWTEANFDFAGYVTGFDPAAFADREALRAELGYGPDERVCVVTVGGSGVGESLLRRVLDAVAPARQLVDGIRFVVVAGPRIDPGGLPQLDGVAYHRYVPELFRHLAACDLAVVQGGLTTCMELTANRRPFVYVPLQHHFEQNLHVHHRLRRHRAGRRLEYADARDADGLAAVIAQEIGRDVDYLPVDTGGAARAAASIAELL